MTCTALHLNLVQGHITSALDMQTETAWELYKASQNPFVNITAPFKTGFNVEETIFVNIIIMVN